MKVPCDVIMDLLPLYYDGVCSEDSKKIVADHLAECEACRAAFEKIKDSTVDGFLKKERGDVVGRHTRSVKRKSLAVGIGMASVMAVPILVCLIVNLATGHGLDWFFIVLTALMTLASLTVVPLVAEKEKLPWALGSFTISLTLLLLTCAVYSGGDWFFVAMIPILFGLCILFAPYVLKRLPLKGFWAQHKGLLAMAADTLLLFATIAVCGAYRQGSTWLGYWRPALLITLSSLPLPWGLFLIIRYVKANAWIRAGLCVFLGGLIPMIDTAVDWIIDGVLRSRFSGVNLLLWNNTDVINANINLLILLGFGFIGGALLLIGLLRKKKA